MIPLDVKRICYSHEYIGDGASYIQNSSAVEEAETSNQFSFMNDIQKSFDIVNDIV
jgi:hypothetical protein